MAGGEDAKRIGKIARTEDDRVSTTQRRPEGAGESRDDALPRLARTRIGTK